MVDSQYADADPHVSRTVCGRYGRCVVYMDRGLG